MKIKILFLILFIQFNLSSGQSILINQITSTPVSNGINVNLLVTTYNGAGYLSHSYTVDGNSINLSVCYWFDTTLPVYQINNDFLISVPNNLDYIINVSIFNSSSQIICDNFSNGPTSTINYLNYKNFEDVKDEYSIFPNPNKGIIYFNGNKMLINKLEIFDNLGRLIIYINDKITKDIDLSKLEDGIYYVNIETELGNLIQKLIVKKQ